MNAAPSHSFSTDNTVEPEDDLEFEFLAPARARFRGLLVERILAFEAYRQQALQEDTATDALKSIGDLSHKIRGVAATLGFAALGEHAMILEQKINGGTANQTPPSQVIALIDESLEALLGAMETILEDCPR